ncbi:MAG: HAMP domain-containing histidine kinase, partial [Spirochaetes bacterium]|nr:HAMP domain-containing histidine kinase [Spirochaetota bacterium]
AAVQTFVVSGGIWVELGFSGDARYRLAAPPVTEPGHTIRELPRDFGTIRYVQTAIAATGTTAAAAPAPALRFISYRLGDDFDTGMAAIENQIIHLEIIDTLQANVRQLILFYFGVFFFPTVLMTIIIAISFTRRVTHPITELTEATRRVAEGDFSIQILSSPGDELGLLIRSFNAMVRDLDKSRLALLKNEKMSIWQNMAQQLAHEVKNPLTPIRLCAERVLRRFQNEPERTGEIVESSMKAIIHEVEGLSNLLNEFRNMSKPMEPSRSWTALKETVAEIIESLANSYPKIHFDTTHLQEGLSIKIDKHRLSQVITNIVINAIDAMDESGFIEIRCDIVKKRDLSYCRINIKDTGKGISAEDARLIFNPYFTTKTTGTGLGLVVVERIVADHGGSVWFNSELGAGSTFYVDLPLGAAASAGADAVADAGASAGGGAAGAGGGAVGAGGEE